MAAVHWVEILKCNKCGRAGLAELWDSAAYEGQADLVPPGFRMDVLPGQGPRHSRMLGILHLYPILRNSSTVSAIVAL